MTTLLWFKILLSSVVVLGISVLSAYANEYNKISFRISITICGIALIMAVVSLLGFIWS